MTPLPSHPSVASADTQARWQQIAKRIRDLCESSGWDINQTQAELATAAVWDEILVAAAAVAETNAEAAAANLTRRALQAPNSYPILADSDRARRRLTAARQTRQAAVQRLLQHRQDDE